MSDWNFSDDENDTEVQEKDPSFGRDGIIFLIDCRSDMFIKDLQFSKSDDEDDTKFCSAFSLGLQCCREMMLHKIQTSVKSVIGVIFFGIKNGDLTWKHIVEFQPLSEPSAEKIKSVDSIRISETNNDFENTYGHSTDACLADVFSACLFYFNRCSFKLGSKRILLFTKDCNPDSNCPATRHKIRTRAKDLSEAEVDLELMPIGSDFNTKLFYEEIIQSINHQLCIIEPIDGVSYFWDIMDVINKDSYRKRTLARLAFDIGGSLAIGVGVYRFTCKQKYFKKLPLSRKTNEPVKSVVQHLDGETGAVLRPYEVRKVVTFASKADFASKEVSFSNDEYSKVKKVFKPGLTLLGFKPKDDLKLEFHCSAPYFLFPDEFIVKGSSQLFKALLNKCIAKNVVAVCVMVLRVGSHPKYVMVEPQEEVCDEDSKQILPAGFLVYNLPFSRMLAEMPGIPNNSNSIDDTKLSAVTKLIKQLKIKNYVSDYFENPSLEKQWINIEALALQQAKPKEFVDTTIEYFERLENRLQDVKDEFINAFFSEDNVEQGTKRKAGTSNDTSGKIPKKI